MPRRKSAPAPDCFLFHPVDFEPNQYGGHIARYPDAAAFALSSIFIKNTSRKLDRRRYVGLHSEILANVMGGADIAPRVMSQLKEVGLIECDGHYIVGEKPLGYRFGKAAHFPKWEKRAPKDKRAANRINAFKAWITTPPKCEEPSIGHLRGWMEKVRFSDKLDETIEGLPDIQYNEYAEFGTKKELARYQSDLTEGGFKRMTQCPQGRVHSNLTSICGELRQCLQIDGEPLFEIDIVNSQPFFLACLACDWEKVACNWIAPGKGQTERDTNHQGTLPYELGSVPPPDKLRMLSRCSQGMFYDDFVLGDDWSRDEIKEQFIRSIFGRPFQMIEECGGEWLREAYPTVWATIMYLKQKHGHAYVGRVLQTMESNVVIRGACERLRLTYPSIPITTCHDSIATTERHLETVQRVLRESFEAFPATPSFKIKPPRS